MSRAVLFFLLSVTLLNACESKQSQKKPTYTVLMPDTLKKFNENDTKLIEYSFAKIVKSDTVKSETGCSEVIVFYNRDNKVLIRKNEQHCISDTRSVWYLETFFNEKGDTLLFVKLDGLKRVLQIERNLTN